MGADRYSTPLLAPPRPGKAITESRVPSGRPMRQAVQRLRPVVRSSVSQPRQMGSSALQPPDACLKDLALRAVPGVAQSLKGQIPRCRTVARVLFAGLGVAATLWLSLYGWSVTGRSSFLADSDRGASGRSTNNTCSSGSP